jgi:subtilase family serine protease
MLSFSYLRVARAATLLNGTGDLGATPSNRHFEVALPLQTLQLPTMRTFRPTLLLIAFACTFCPSPAHAAPFTPNGQIIVPESSGIGARDKETLQQHTRLRVLVVPQVAAPTIYAQFNTPATVRSVYNLPSTGGSNAIAIVDAYHYPTALQDFNGFSQVFGLPTESSTNATLSSNQHFQVVYASGHQPQSGGSYIGSWNLEEALDIEWAHAMAPNAKIYLVEAASASMSDLDNAVRVAANLAGVKEVSMSWGGSETSYEASQFDSIFVKSGVVFFASSGDSSDEMEYPAASPNVVACGGTTINRTSGGTYVNQTAWNEAGCGPSVYEARPSFQAAVSSVVGTKRGVADISFNANPNSGVYVYDSTPFEGSTGWWILGGTSVASPCLAGVVNVAGGSNGFAASSAAEETRIYTGLGNSSNFTDVSSGTDGRYSSKTGYDFPTGVGVPRGLVGK